MLHMRQIIAGKGTGQRRIHRRLWKGATGHAKHRLARRHPAILGHTDLDVHTRRRCRPGGAQNLFAAHYDLHRLVGLATEGKRHRINKHCRLAAKTAANL